MPMSRSASIAGATVVRSPPGIRLETDQRLDHVRGAFERLLERQLAQRGEEHDDERRVSSERQLSTSRFPRRGKRPHCQKVFAHSSTHRSTPSAAGTGTILLVEDDQSIRSAVARMLTRAPAPRPSTQLSHYRLRPAKIETS